jgi:hypothetical protein
MRNEIDVQELFALIGKLTVEKQVLQQNVDRLEAQLRGRQRPGPSQTEGDGTGAAPLTA